jgi:hypothetical protein
MGNQDSYAIGDPLSIHWTRSHWKLEELEQLHTNSHHCPDPEQVSAWPEEVLKQWPETGAPKWEAVSLLETAQIRGTLAG